VIEAESQAVLTLAQNMTSMMYLTDDRSAGNSAYTWTMGTALRVMVASKPEVLIRGQHQSRKLWIAVVMFYKVENCI
jgi:hypothetical protein